MLEAVRDTIIIKPKYEEARGGIIIPDTARVYKQHHGYFVGEVVAVGPLYKNELKPGDVVLYERHEGYEVGADGCLALRSEWVAGIKEGEEGE